MECERRGGGIAKKFALNKLGGGPKKFWNLRSTSMRNLGINFLRLCIVQRSKEESFYLMLFLAAAAAAIFLDSLFDKYLFSLKCKKDKKGKNKRFFFSVCLSKRFFFTLYATY